MNDRDVDAYRVRELNAWDTEYEVVLWRHLPEEAREKWRHDYRTRGQEATA